jgi:hypothetical protein
MATICHAARKMASSPCPCQNSMSKFRSGNPPRTTRVRQSRLRVGPIFFSLGGLWVLRAGTATCCSSVYHKCSISSASVADAAAQRYAISASFSPFVALSSRRDDELLVPQSDHRIDSHRPAGRHIGGEERDEKDQHLDNRKNQWIGGLYVVEQRTHQAG